MVNIGQITTVIRIERAWKEGTNAGRNFRNGRDEIKEEIKESMDKISDELSKAMLGPM
ncbi:hypothetical protein FRACYDRAFT_270982 [Fragilariopsis cylindrus CCMP1102]|uniref:Uncharacterized protein n=1 Tax=Fragilariopsis cylindrus CCMP1102 TaxID=635003 RepID=A0A1E7EXJ3_9STRA|nr:hypothetical protein FRACYDRAFT_270982 [Fragilariopsis cylindrus CCMP1102]|eukprot:OEU10758.1 hypothetical protein FRACYDRAFT_270982 [Fragilariopsis cylindrus CCMP1102]